MQRGEQEMDVEATGNHDPTKNKGDNETERVMETTTENESKEEDLDMEHQPLTEAQKVYGWFITDILIYIVILNLAAELVKTIVINSFGISICCALFLKIFLDFACWIEKKMHHFFCTSPRFGLSQKIMGAITIYTFLLLAKFFILWVDETIFKEWVQLGHLWEIVVLALVMVLMQRISRGIFHQLSRPMESWSWIMFPLQALVETENWMEARLHHLDKRAAPCLCSHVHKEQNESS
jgi:hypothetical protein